VAAGGDGGPGEDAEARAHIPAHVPYLGPDAWLSGKIRQNQCDSKSHPGPVVKPNFSANPTTTPEPAPMLL